ncbi:RNA polymerase sigma factor [Microbacterium sp. MYb62]|uniref:RNA polymerase sigma factor n=1 Tax=Microbacterium sp. MYb62 TaxID=1848690 RepID=UPI000CFC1C4E|nr:sigma-70 family RNA polymerase sigma factor [Microbacterium sp. MYb62]PRB10261.1 RNA polymerase subunit sigma-24 [Microbacterium sp. MYb62]
MSGTPGRRRIEEILRRESPQVLGALVRRFGRFDLAEDATQEALLSAHRTWQVDALPAEPRGWLIRVGYRKLIDLLRAEDADRRREYEWLRSDPRRADAAAPSGMPLARDDSLELLALCCHPALTDSSQIALTLRAVGGLTTAEIAHAYGVPEATMATRISRAKQTLRKAGARFELTGEDDLAARVSAVERVLYLIFNEGYTATTGLALVRVDLTTEAIRLTRMLVSARGDDPEAQGLLAFMLLTEARRDARQIDDDLVVLDDQDRGVWDRALIGEGSRLIETAWARGEVGAFQLQAAISAVHVHAETAVDTDWPQIAALYLWLERLEPSGIVRLSRVVAVSRAFGARRGLALFDDLDRMYGLSSDPLTAARARIVRAHLLDDIGEHAAARAGFAAAAADSANEVEKRYLDERARG